jgi:hypothetical protein
MAIAMLLEFRGTTVEQYDAVIRDLNLGGKAYKGGIFHVAGPVEGGVRIVDVWESQEAFDAFLRDKLGAVMQKNNVAPPEVSAWPVRNTLTPSGPAHTAS